MQEDKHLKELLTKYAVEHPSAHFTSGVMQRIASAPAFNIHTQPLFKHKPVQILAGIFILVFMMLIVLSLVLPVKALPLPLTLSLPEKLFSQIVSFLIAFWVVLFFNLLFNKSWVNISDRNK